MLLGSTFGRIKSTRLCSLVRFDGGAVQPIVTSGPDCVLLAVDYVPLTKHFTLFISVLLHLLACKQPSR
jgi:hypothetical protein